MEISEAIQVLTSLPEYQDLVSKECEAIDIVMVELDRLQKENEELKENIERENKKKAFGTIAEMKLGDLIKNDYISKDKIREKIEEIKEEDLELRETDSEGDIVTKCEQRAVLNILQDLLK